MNSVVFNIPQWLTISEIGPRTYSCNIALVTSSLRGLWGVLSLSYLLLCWFLEMSTVTFQSTVCVFSAHVFDLTSMNSFQSVMLYRLLHSHESCNTFLLFSSLWTNFPQDSAFRKHKFPKKYWAQNPTWKC